MYTKVTVQMYKIDNIFNLVFFSLKGVIEQFQ